MDLRGFFREDGTLYNKLKPSSKPTKFSKKDIGIEYEIKLYEREKDRVHEDFLRWFGEDDIQHSVFADYVSKDQQLIHIYIKFKSPKEFLKKRLLKNGIKFRDISVTRIYDYNTSSYHRGSRNTFEKQMIALKKLDENALIMITDPLSLNL